MTTDELKRLGRRMYEAINAQDLGALEELFAPDIVRHATGEVGIERAKSAVRNAFRALPDTRFEVEHGRVAEIWGAGTTSRSDNS